MRWKSGYVEVEALRRGDRILLSAPRLLSTLPLGLLTEKEVENAVNFNPPLASKAGPISKLRVGHVVRVSMVFRRRFWAEMKAEGRSLRKMTFLFSRNPDFPTWWTVMPFEAPVLTAWAPADAAERLSALSNHEICERALRSLARVFHVSEEFCRQELLQPYTHNWQNDAYSKGAYSYVAAGGSDTQREFAKPINSTLFFAGEATNSEGHHGTVHGAIRSGYRAAEEVLGSFSVPLLTYSN